MFHPITKIQMVLICARNVINWGHAVTIFRFNVVELIYIHSLSCSKEIVFQFNNNHLSIVKCH